MPIRMKPRTKPQLRQALAEILEQAKSYRDLSDGLEFACWTRIVKLAYDGLGEPSIAEIDKLRGKS